MNDPKRAVMQCELDAMTSKRDALVQAVNRIANARDTLTRQLAEAQAKLQSQAYVCQVCWTNSYEPWWRRLCCWQHSVLLEQKQQLPVTTADNAALLEIYRYRINSFSHVERTDVIDQPHPGTALLDELARLRGAGEGEEK